ncbi:hypothetical protein DPMN_102957 [Dreissena polymorpha]|uniref:Uncharacterized protein n=1 Tax=Dreissena polymorpha TaxID=45954 RepID=A0A9D4K0C5_DREPO|nr:hypothetical protein DPMN_102957 [Dreissena polymorpha]
MIQKPKISARMRINYNASTDEISAEKQVQIQRWLTSVERQQPPPEVAVMDATGASQKPHVDTSDEEKLASIKAALERLDSGTVASSFSGRSNGLSTCVMIIFNL